MTERRRVQDEMAGQLHAERGSLEEDRQRLIDERNQLDAQRQALEGERQTHLDWVALERSRLNEIEATLAAAETTTTSSNEQVDSEQPSTTDEEKKLDQRVHLPADEDVFARLRALSLLREDDDKAEVKESRLSAASTVEPPVAENQIESPPVVPASPPAVSSSGNHEGEESIDAYMSQLFSRLNGGRSGGTQAVANPSTAVTPAAKPSNQTGKMSVDPKSRQTKEFTSPETLEEMPLDQPASEYLTEMPRRAATQQPIDLTAMRELANLIANSAIGARQRRRWTSSATIKLGGAAALGSVGIGMLMFAMSSWAGAARPTLLGFGAVLFLAGAVWLLQGMGLLLLVSRSHGATAQAASDSPRGSNVVEVPQVVADTDVVEDARQAP